MKIYRYEDSLCELHKSTVNTVFLAGPTVRGNQPHLTSWRVDAIAEFEKQEFKGDLVLPEFISPRESDKGKRWIPRWEFAGLCAVDVIMFWVPRTKELIGLTTNHEHGYWLGNLREKLVYGRPDDGYRNEYLDDMWEMDAIQKGIEPLPIPNTLESVVNWSIAQCVHNRGQRVKSVVPVESPYGAF